MLVHWLKLTEIVMPASTVKEGKSTLCHIIEENLPGASIFSAPRRDFAEEAGKEYINHVKGLAGALIKAADVGRGFAKCRGCYLWKVSLSSALG
jgi:hypothetical protein